MLSITSTCLAAYPTYPAMTCPKFDFANDFQNMPENMGGATEHCEKTTLVLTTIENAGGSISAYMAAARSIPGMRIYLCEGNDTGIGEQFNGVYAGSLRRLALSQSLLQSEISLIKEVMRHELFHAACHAWHLALDKETINDKDKNKQQPFITSKQKKELENNLANGMRAFKDFSKTYVKNPKSIELRNQIAAIKDDYNFWKRVPYNETSDILLASLLHLNFISNDPRLDAYKPEDALKEKLAYLFAEVPYPLLELFFPKICNYVTDMSNAAVTQQNEMPILESPIINPNYVCADFKQDLRDYQLTTWLNLKVYKIEELDHFFIFVNYAAIHPKKDLIRAKTKEALFNLLNKSQVLSDPTRMNPTLNEKRHLAYLYSARLAFEDKDYDKACKYYKLAEKNPSNEPIKPPHTNFNDEADYAFALRQTNQIKKSIKIAKHAS